MNLAARLAAFAHDVWREKGVISTLLLPFSWLVALTVARKQQRYRQNPQLAWRAPVPVIVVGNIFVGGTGKTPLIIALVQTLRQLGWTPGVISRGYGVKSDTIARIVQGDDANPACCGDEPALIARSTCVPVAIHPRRVLAAQALLRAHPETDVILSDDGLQHLALARDLEIVVQDTRGLGNGRLLPAGPLREPAQRLNNIDYLVTQQSLSPLADGNHTDNPFTQFEADRPKPAQTSGQSRNLSTQLTQAIPVLVDMCLMPDSVVHLVSGETLSWPAWLQAYGDRRPSAAAAIGNPARFFDMLRASGLQLGATLALPDHYAYTASPFSELGAAPILLTPKDAVKCHSLSDERLWEVRTQTRFSPPDWMEDIHARLRAILSCSNKQQQV